MRKRLIASFGTITILLLSVNCQQEAYELVWSETNRLTVMDFGMDYNGNTSMPCYAQFSMNYSVSGFDFLAKNLNQKVKNVMYTNASWIDKTNADVDRMIWYQQLLFDLAEVHARRFRKVLFINRKEIAKGIQIAENLNVQIVEEMTKERAKFEKESENGLQVEVMQNWEKKIELELQELTQFRFENTSKIKL